MAKKQNWHIGICLISLIIFILIKLQFFKKQIIFLCNITFKSILINLGLFQINYKMPAPGISLHLWYFKTCEMMSIRYN